jgi:hypothetical protein
VLINAGKNLIGKPEGKILLERPRWRWEDNIKMALTEIGYEMWIAFDWLRMGTGGWFL